MGKASDGDRSEAFFASAVFQKGERLWMAALDLAGRDSFQNTIQKKCMR